MSPANYRPPFERQTEIDLAHAGTQWFFSAQKELLCRGRMQLWTSSCSTSVQEGYRDIYSKLYLFLYICRSNLPFYIWAFSFFYLFFSLLSKVKERLLVPRYFTLHSNPTARRVAVPCDVRVSAINARSHSGKTWSRHAGNSSRAAR